MYDCRLLFAFKTVYSVTIDLRGIRRSPCMEREPSMLPGCFRKTTPYEKSGLLSGEEEQGFFDPDDGISGDQFWYIRAGSPAAVVCALDDAQDTGWKTTGL